MKYKYFLLGFWLFLSLSITGQLKKFGKPATFSDLHTVYEYKKSNWDGTHSSSIFLYVADKDRLESFKLWEGEKTATLVSAKIDWSTYSVSEFQNHRLRSGGPDELIATLSMTIPDKIKVVVGEMKDSLLLAGLPWQSYDFDFAGLGFIWRALINKKDSFWVHIADAAMVDNNMAFVNKGKVSISFQGHEMIKDKNCLKFSANGPGLEYKGGFIWVNSHTFMIEQYKIELPDEPGFENGMLRLVNTTKMHQDEWEKFKRNKLDL